VVELTFPLQQTVQFLTHPNRHDVFPGTSLFPQQHMPQANHYIQPMQPTHTHQQQLQPTQSYYQPHNQRMSSVQMLQTNLQHNPVTTSQNNSTTITHPVASAANSAKAQSSETSCAASKQQLNYILVNKKTLI
jgi:hypothetical protein